TSTSRTPGTASSTSAMRSRHALSRIPMMVSTVRVVTGVMVVRSLSGTPGREAVEEAREILDIERRWGGALVAVGVAVAGGKSVQEAREVGDIQDGGRGGAVAVRVARHGGGDDHVVRHENGSPVLAGQGTGVVVDDDAVEPLREGDAQRLRGPGPRIARGRGLGPHERAVHVGRDPHPRRV